MHLVSGSLGDDVDVRRVSVTELLDPSRYLERDELVLTNGLWRRRRRDSDAFVSALAMSRAVALGYGLASEHGDVPADVVGACERRSMPLLAVPFRIPFTAIAGEVAAHHSAEEHDHLVRGLRRNDTLLHTLVDGAGPEGILRIAHRALDRPLAALTRTGRVIAECGGPAPRFDVCRLAPTGSRSPFEVLVEDAAWSAFAVSSGGRVDGHLLCRSPLAALSAEERLALEQARAFLALEFARRAALRAAEARYAGELIGMVFDGRFAEARARLHTFEIAAEDGVGAVALVADGSTSRHDLSTIATGAAALDGVPSVAGWVDDALVVVAATDEPVTLRELASHALAVVRGEAAEARVSAGVGDCARSLEGLRRSVVEALHAARLAAGSPSRRLLAAADVGDFRLLLELQPPELVERFCDHVLAPLEEHDRRRHGDLVLTLEVFLECCCRWTPAAERLHVHPNTLRYRIDRIEELTGRSLRRMGDRVDFHLALCGRGMTRGAGALEDPPNRRG